MDKSTFDNLAELICGTEDFYPEYRSVRDIAAFFLRTGIQSDSYEGNSRKEQTIAILNNCNDSQIISVILRLATPGEYKGDRDKVKLAIKHLNRILEQEGKKIVLEGSTPKLSDAQIDYGIESDALAQFPCPDFNSLGLDTELARILKIRWEEIQKCLSIEAYLSATILMGSLMEGLLLGALNRYKNIAYKAAAELFPPVDKNKRQEPFENWNLAKMIELCHKLQWIDHDVKSFSHALREFRNLIHPNHQLQLNAFPDGDTCKISWSVVQATCNDLANVLRGMR